MTSILALSWAACGGDGGEGTGGNLPGTGPSGTFGSSEDACAAEGFHEPEGWYEVLSLEEIVNTEDPETGERYMAWVPEQPVAALWVFHGNGGDIGKLQQLEYLRVYNPLIADGYAILAKESLIRGNDAHWDYEKDSADKNPDMIALQALRAKLIDETGLEEETPMFGVGFSGGASFVGTWAELGRRDFGWDIRGIDCHNGSPGLLPAMDSMHNHAENDDANSAEAGYQDMEEAYPKRTHELAIHAEVPLDPLRMLSLGYSEEDSIAVFGELVEMGLIDSDGVRIFDIGDLENVLDEYSRQSTAPSPEKVTGVLRVVWATHRLNGENNKAIRNTFTCGNLMGAAPE